MSNNLCQLPFSGVSISPYGTVRPCCLIGNANNKVKEMHEIQWETKQILKLRKQFLNNERPEECKACWHTEDNGGISYRQQYNSQIASLALFVKKDLINKPELIFGDIQFGRLCNSACLMCRPAVSTKLETERKKIFKIIPEGSLKESYKKSFGDYPKKDWTADEVEYNKIKELCKDITIVKMSGGEPLMNPKIIDFIDYLLTKERPVVAMHITTNFTDVSEQVIETIKRIPKPVLKISIDGIGPADEFIRFPAKFVDKENKIKQLLSKPGRIGVTFCSVLQSVNLLDFEKLANYPLLQNYKQELQISFFVDDYTSHYHCDLEYLDYAEQFYLKTDISFRETILKAIRNAQQFTERKIIRMLEHVKNQEIISGISVKDTFPIFYEYHKKYGILE
jgi:radical SAM protein with 4Fe4S-binding SPASM domain